MKKTKKEEFILYNNVNDENKIQDKNAVYDKIDKRQRRNSKILCISIFLYFLALAFLFGTMDYFEKIENEDLWLLSTLMIIIVATILLIISLVTKSKEGKIKYQYKNMKYFYISLVFLGLGSFIIFGGLGIKDVYISLTTGFILLGLCASFDIYHDKTKGKEKGQISLILEFVIAFTVAIICGFGGYILNEKVYRIDYDQATYTYYKTTEVVYNKEDRAYMIAKSGDTWYTFTNKYKSEHYEFSDGNTPQDLNIMYENDNVNIWHLYGNDDYAVWSEIQYKDNAGKVEYCYYDKEEEQVWELLTLPFTDEMPQNFNLGLYKDKIYYELLDYDEGTIQVMEYNLTENETTTIYKVTGKTKDELANQSIDVNGNNLLVTTYLKDIPTIMHVNLDKVHEEGYKPDFVYLNSDVSNFYSVSYEDDTYAVYYNDYMSDKISLFGKDGKSIKQVVKFNKDYYAFNDEIYLKNSNLYWIDFDNKNQDKKAGDKFKLKIYNLKDSRVYSVDKIFDFTVSGNKVYGLGFYKDNPENVRLFEIWK